MEAAQLAFQTSIGQYAGHSTALDPNTVVIDTSLPGLAEASIYLIDLENMNVDQITSSLYSILLQNFQAAVNASLTSSQVTLDRLGLSVTFAGDPAQRPGRR